MQKTPYISLCESRCKLTGLVWVVATGSDSNPCFCSQGRVLLKPFQEGENLDFFFFFNPLRKKLATFSDSPLALISLSPAGLTVTSLHLHLALNPGLSEHQLPVYEAVI